MKIKSIITCLTLMCAASQATLADGYLRTEGHAIVNEQGEKVILRGMGLGGWMLQEATCCS